MTEKPTADDLFDEEPEDTRMEREERRREFIDAYRDHFGNPPDDETLEDWVEEGMPDFEPPTGETY